MEVINSLFAFLSKLVKWWFVVMPWEQAIRVRHGNKVAVLKEGMYFKIPFIDSVYIQSIRLRTVDIPIQTISSKDGITVTVKAYIAYSIADIFLLYKTLYHPQATLSSVVNSSISGYIRENEILNISPNTIESIINTSINGAQYGLQDVSVKITTFAVVKTFRLIQDSSTSYHEDLKMEEIK
jgi:regulator of protease activity HflC (stomatin/prohibitin superfamily)